MKSFDVCEEGFDLGLRVVSLAAEDCGGVGWDALEELDF